MADGVFEEALLKGLAACEAQDVVRKEVKQVLRLASDDITKALGVETSLVYDPEAAALVALVGIVRPGRKIAGVECGAAGYPVTVTFGGEFEDDHVAHDQAEFERTLLKLLEHPTTGGALKALVREECDRRRDGY